MPATRGLVKPLRGPFGVVSADGKGVRRGQGEFQRVEAFGFGAGLPAQNGCIGSAVGSSQAFEGDEVVLGEIFRTREGSHAKITGG